MLRNDEGIKSLSHLVIQPSSFIDYYNICTNKLKMLFAIFAFSTFLWFISNVQYKRKKFFGSCISGTRLKIVTKQMFQLRLKKLLDFLMNNRIFGLFQCRMIETRFGRCEYFASVRRKYYVISDRFFDFCGAV